MFKQSIFSVFNKRIAIVILDALFVFWLYTKLDLKMMVDLYIISIAIVFPLVFTITSAFNKRQDSLKHFSSLRTKIIELSNIVSAVKKITTSNKKKFNQLLLKTHREFYGSLINSSNESDRFNSRLHSKEIFDFIIQNNQHFSEIEKNRSLVVKSEIFTKIELLRALESHGTPLSLRNYCLIFIYLFPWIYTPSLIQDVSTMSQDYNTYMAIVFSIFISFILMALFNVQSFIENPFDQKGLDDIKMNDFQIKEQEF